MSENGSLPAGFTIRLSASDALRAAHILKKPVTALEFADAFWPDRANDRRRSRARPSSRSRAGHALLRGLIEQGIVRRNSSGDPKHDTFVVATAPAPVIVRVADDRPTPPAEPVREVTGAAAEQTETVETVVVSPKLAAEWLERFGNRKNRHINPHRVRYYRDLMALKRWMVSGEAAISFDVFGMLLNGHHRLEAVILLGLDVVFIVRRNVRPDVLQYIDAHQARTAGQIGRMLGIDTRQDDALKVIMTICSASETDGAGYYNRYVSALDIERGRELFAKELSLLEVGMDGVHWPHHRKVRAGIRAGIIMCLLANPDSAQRFMNALQPVIDRTSTEPRAVVNLVRWLEGRHSTSGGRVQIEDAEVTINSFEQFCSGEIRTAVKSGGFSFSRSRATEILELVRARVSADQPAGGRPAGDTDRVPVDPGTG